MYFADDLPEGVSPEAYAASMGPTPFVPPGSPQGIAAAAAQQSGDAAAIANAIKAGVGIYTLPQQIQQAQMQSQLTQQQQAAQNQAKLLALMAQGKPAPAAFPSWAIYAGVGVLALVLVIAATRR